MIERRRSMHPWKRRALVFALAVVVSLLPTLGLRSAHARSADVVAAPLNAIPPQEQPFDPSLQVFSSSWIDIVLHQVFGKAQKPLSCTFSP